MSQDKSDPIRTKVTELIGEASMLNQAVVGVFDSDRAMEIVDKILKVCGRESVEPNFVESRLKEVRETIALLKQDYEMRKGEGTSDPIVNAVEGLTGVVNELFAFMVQIRELQFGSDPGGTVPPGGCLMDLIRRTEDLEVRVRRSEWNIPVLDHLKLKADRDGIVQSDGGGENFRQLVSNIRSKPGLDVSDERDRALLWAADQFEAQAPPIVRGTLKRIDDRSDDISPEFQKVIDEVATLKLSEAEAIWRDLNHADTQNSADCFAAAVRAAVGLQSDLKHVIEAASDESEQAEKLRNALHQVSDVLDAVKDARMGGNRIKEQSHLREAQAIAARALLGTP